MPCFRMSGDTFFIWHEQIPGGLPYPERLASDLHGLCHQEVHANVKLHCKNGAKLLAHKVVFPSKLLKDFFELTSCSCFATADIVCTDFSVRAVSKLLDLLYSGVTYIKNQDSGIVSEMREVIQHLGLIISLPDLELNEYESCSIRHPKETSEESIEDEEDIKIDEMNLAEVSTETCAAEAASDDEIIDIEDDEVEETGQLQHETYQPQPESVQSPPETAQPQPDGVQSQPAEDTQPKATKISLICHICDKVFPVNIALRKHMERFHNVNENATPEAPENDMASYIGKPCPKCDEFIRGKDMEAHVTDCNGTLSGDDDIVDKTNAEKKGRITRKRTIKNNCKLASSIGAEKLKYKFKCYICPRFFCTYGGAIRHIAYNHFKEQLERTYGPSKTICVLCNKIYSDQSSLFVHLSMIHGALDNKIPQKHSLEIHSENELHLESKTPNPDTAKTCFICNKTFNKTVKLTCHYAWTHFKAEIEKLESLCTPNCPKFGSTGYNRIVHLAVRHSALKGFIPNDHCIVSPKKLPTTKKKKNKKFAKKILIDTSGLATECKFCRKKFTPGKSFSNHMKHCKNKLGQIRRIKRIIPATVACHLCPKKRTTHQMMVWHLAWDHCRAQLMEKLGFDETAKNCPICKEPKNQLMGIIIHLAQKHEQLKGLIESEVLENLWKNLSRIKAPSVTASKVRVKKLRCQRCRKFFSHPGALTCHTRVCKVASPKLLTNHVATELQ